MLNKRHTSERQLHIQKRTGIWVKPTGSQEKMSDSVWLPGTPGTWQSHPAGTEDVSGSREGFSSTGERLAGPSRMVASCWNPCLSKGCGQLSHLPGESRSPKAAGCGWNAVHGDGRHSAGLWPPRGGPGVWQEVGGWQWPGVGGLPRG